MKKIILWGIILFSTNIFAQNIFEKKYDFFSFDAALYIHPTYDSGYIITGSSNENNFDIRYFKTNKNGDTLWTKKLSGAAYEVPYCSFMTIDSGLIILADNDMGGTEDVWMIKTNSAGDTLWTKIFGSSSFHERPLGIGITSANEFLIGAHIDYDGDNFGDDFWLIKTNSAGDTLWTKVIGGSGKESFLTDKIVESSDGKYMLLGSTTGTGNGGYDFYLLQMDANGDTLWTKTFGTAGDDIPSHLEKTADNGFLLLGKFEMPLDSNNLTLIKTDMNGNLQWIKHPGKKHTDMGKHFLINADGSILLTGTTGNSSSQNDVLLMKLDANGDTLWTKNFGGEYNDNGTALCKTSDNGIGIIANTEGFGFISNDIYFIKTDTDGNKFCPQLFFSVSDSAFCNDTSLTFYNTSIGTSQYSWYINDTLFSNVISANYFFQNAGTYNVKLKSCSDSVSKTITHWQNPSADFIFTVKKDTVDFSFNPPVNLQSFLWDFGDGNIDLANINPIHVFDSIGLYPVSLTVTDSNGCSNMVFKQVSILPNAISEFRIQNVECKIYPNPFNTSALIVIAIGAKQSIYDLRFTIYDLLGREVRKLQITDYRFQIKRENLPNGIYFYKIENDKEILAIGKIIVQH